jgi:SNF2 family DNA or RNA helicase
VKFFQEKMGYFWACLDLDQYIEKRKELGPDAYIVLLLNREALPAIMKQLRKLHWDIVVWDEVQDIKDRTSRASRDAMLLARSIDYRLALTGTPMDLSEKDLWAIMRFVNPEVFGDVWKDFEEEYIKDISEKYREKIKATRNATIRQRLILAMSIAKRKAPLHEEGKVKFAKRIRKWVMRISKEQAGITEARIKPLWFDMKGPQERKYRQLEKTMIVKHKGKVITAPLKIVQMGKLQQMTGGHIKDEDGEVHVVGKGKRKLLQHSVEEHAPDEPFVIFCKYVWEVHLLADVLRSMGFRKVAKLWGKVKDLRKSKPRTQMLLDFQSGKYDAMVCQQKTGGVGVDLFRARVAFVYSFGHSFIDWDQMISRLDFLEQKQPGTIFVLLARNSIDTDLYQSVKLKKSITETFYGRLGHNKKKRDYHGEKGKGSRRQKGESRQGSRC